MRRPQPARLRETSLPAPSGLNAVDPPGALGPRDAVLLVNLIAGQRGLKPRPGTQEQATNVGTIPGEVRAILPFHAGAGGADKLFATAVDGIYDVSTPTTSPSRSYTFPSGIGLAGYGIATSFTGVDGTHYLLYADEVNGYLRYTEGGAWAAGSVTGVAPGMLAFVMAWKQRLWFVERGSTRAWYLGLGAIDGEATEFDFGPLFKTGGTLVGLWSWTMDGGAGADDRLVAVSSAGDVVVFRGTDPNSASTFQQEGEWSLGGVPAGRRVATPFGGDILLITRLGLLPLSKLVTGQLVAPDTYETRAIRPLFDVAMNVQGEKLGWCVQNHPTDNFLMVNAPGLPGLPQEQFAMSYATRGWSLLRGLDILSMDVWRGSLYFGTRDGRVMRNVGGMDGVSTEGGFDNAKPVRGVVLGAFFTGQSPKLKQVRLLRPKFITEEGAPAVAPFVRYEYDITEPLTDPSFYGVQGVSSAWGSGLWGTATWGGGGAAALGTYSRAFVAATGIGGTFAVGLVMLTQAPTIFTSIDVAWEEGGLL